MRYPWGAVRDTEEPNSYGEFNVELEFSNGYQKKSMSAQATVQDW